MKFLVVFIALMFSLSVASQTKDAAVGRYAEGGSLISITNLTGLSECASASVMGKIGKVKVEDAFGRVSVKTENTDESVDVPLDRLKPDDRSSIFKHLVRKKAKVRIAGYRCVSDGPITAFSIDRIY